MKKIITSFSSRAAMMLLTTLLLTMTAQTAWADNVNYLDESGSTQTAVNPTAVTNGMQELGSNGETTWYVVNSNVTISRELKISGTVHLILADSKELTVNNSNASGPNGYFSIYMDEGGSSLTVYSQSIGNDMGKLMASTTDGSFFVTSLTINGGQISVTGTTNGVYINDGGSMVVNNGHVTINSTYNSPAINNTGLLHINGGTVIANGLDISKANPTVTAPTPRTLVYSGSAQELVTAGTTTHGTMIYSTDGSNYSEAIPTGTEVGTYTVYYKVEEGATWNAVDPQTVSVTIKQGTSYVNAAGEQQLNVDAAAVTGSESSIGENNQTKWYVVTGTVSFSETLGINGDVNLILADNAEMTITADDNSIYMLENSSLTIYTQSHGDNKGKLTITGEGITIERNCSLTINGGHISVTASNHGVYIGSNSSMTVNNGDLTISSSNATAINDLSKYIYNGGTVRLYDNTSSVHQAAYVNAAGEQQASVDVTIVNNRNLGEAGQTTWYFVNGDITFDGLLDISGTVNLIIADGKELTVNTSDTNYGIYIQDNSSLNIYTQSHGDSKGKLTVSSGCPGVYMSGTGNLTINGGLISITSRGYQNVGVYFGSNGSMTINNGDVTITSQQNYAIAATDMAKVTKNGGKLVLNDFGVINDNVSYLDASGVSQSHNVIVLQNTNANIGASGETWYVVRGNTTFNNRISINGNVNLILEDGAVMSIEDASEDYSIYMNEGSSLTIYSQSTGDSKGKLTTTGAISIGSTSILTINGGEITATGDDNDHAFYIKGAMTINGGQVTATGGTHIADNTKEAAISFQDGGTLTLGYNSANDFIQINGITNTNETLGTINVKSGQHFVADDDVIVTGNGVAYSAVVNKKLVPCYAVTFDANGGSFGSETTITLPAKFDTSGNAYVSKPDDPTRDDCTFSEWQLSGTAYDFTATVTSDMTLTAKWKELLTNTEAISYITATGTSDTKAVGTVYILDGTEDELGTSGQTTWYIVPSTATGNNALSYKGRLKLNGDVHLILADGSKMTADGIDDPESGHYDALDAGNSGQLTIYGQANGTGELNAITGSGSRAFNVTGTGCALTICGGVVNAKADFAFNGTSLIIYGGKFTTVAEEGITDNISINATNVQINGGEVTIGGYIQSGTGDVEINGGKVDVSGNIQSTSGDIILGWTNATDHIKATSYQTNTDQDHYVKIADGKVLKYTDGNTVKLLHTGIVLPSSISGKELTPYGIFGYCGDTHYNDGKNVYWSIALNDDPETDAIEFSNTLVIEKNTNASGQTNFDMANYDNDDADEPGNFAPWIKPKSGDIWDESDGLKYPITTVTIADGVTSIGNKAFENCSGLQNVTIGNTVTSIGFRAFDHCSGLQKVNIGNSVTTINGNAFSHSGLQSVTIPASVESINTGAFELCRELQNVTIADGVTTIDSYAFGGCGNLTVVTIPASVTTIGENAFYSCYNLTVVTMLRNDPPSLGLSVFDDCGGLNLILVPDETAYAAYNVAGEGWDGKISISGDIPYKSLLAPSEISLAKNTSGWGTYCHSYPVSYSLSDGATAYTLNGLNPAKTAVTIQEAAVTIEETDVNAVAPLTPLLLNYTAPDNNTETDDETVTLTALPATATTVSGDAIVNNGGTGWNYYGNTTGTTQKHTTENDGIPALTGGGDACYILRNGTFVLVDTDEGIPAHRCVLSVGSSSAARVLTIGTGDETTGIEELKNGRIEELKWAGAWYSLDGRKLDKQPTKKGLYIYNGKKTVIK